MRVRKGSITYYLLLTLEKAAEGSVNLDNFSYSAQRRAILGIKESTKKSTLAQAIRRLRKSGLIEEERNQEGQILLKLSSLGKDFLGKDGEWDGKYRIVIWDIPEKKRVIRNLFRRRLKEWGFKAWQQSVWISKRNVTDKIRKLISELGIEQWIAVIESDDPSLANIKLDDRTS